MVSCRDVRETREYLEVAMDRDSLADELESREKEIKDFSVEFEKIENQFDYEGVIIKHFYGKTETEYSLYQKYRIEMDDYYIFENEGKIDDYPFAW